MVTLVFHKANKPKPERLCLNCVNLSCSMGHRSFRLISS